MGFGTVRMTGANVWGPPPDPAASRRLLRRVVEAGVNFIDTADSYGPAVCEELVAEALHPYSPDLVIATKGGLNPSAPQTFERDCRPERLAACCKASLRRLKLDRIDLYQLHAVDPNVPIEESVGALSGLRDQGLINHIGLSNVTTDDLRRAMVVAPIVSVQNCYNVVDRASDPLLEECARRGIAFLPWFPLARGHLGKANSVLEGVARRLSCTPAQIALAWLLQRSPVIIPIPGTNDVTHFVENFTALDIELDREALVELDAIDARTDPLTDDPATRR